MIRTVAVILFLLLAVACAEEEKPLSEPGEKLYPVRGVIEGRDASDNLLRLRHETIPGFMEAMTMDFSVRGAPVTTLPADGTAVDATLHVTDRAYWLTDVKSR